MRILHVTDNYPPARGGLERTVATIAAGQAAAGHDVVVATLSRTDAPARELGPDGVQVRRLDGWIRHLRRFAADPGHQYHPTFRDPALVRALQAVVDETSPDVVHVHGWILYSAAHLRLARGSALVVSLHDFSLICANKTLLRDGAVCPGPQLRACLSCSREVYGAAKGLPIAAGLAAQRRVHERVDLFVANSRYVAEVSARGSGVARDRFAVVPSPLPDDAAQPSATARPGYLPDGEFVLFAGAMGRHKGLDVLLDAHARLARPVPLVILGIPRRDSPDCDRPGVVVRHDVPHTEVMACWRAATVGAVPSVCAEAFGLVAVEGMLAGTPMVVSAVGGLQEVVEPGVSGLVVPPGDAVALAAALDDALADPPTAHAMGEAGRARAQRYLLSAVLPQFEECYDRAREP